MSNATKRQLFYSLEIDLITVNFNSKPVPYPA